MTLKYNKSQLDLNDFSEKRKSDIDSFIKYAQNLIKEDYERARLEIEQEQRRRQ